MDREYMTKVATSFLDELSQIEREKTALLGTLWRAGKAGLRHWGTAARTAAKPGGGLTMALGGRGAVRAGGLGEHIGGIYRAGAAKAKGVGKSEALGGLGALARSRYGQMALVPAAGIGGIWGARKVLGTSQPQYVR